MALFVNKPFCYFLGFLLYFCVEGSSEDTVKLELVQVLYRHGDRSPVTTYPTDSYNIQDWVQFGAQGYGQLTDLGKRQHYFLGDFFRERYTTTDFMNSTFNNTQLYVRSTDVDRTLMSAYSNLAGFFPPDNTSHWWNETMPKILWQPIPVHTVPQIEDSLLRMDAPCPEADRLYEEEKETNAFKTKSKENEELFKFVANKTENSCEDLDNLWEIIDTLFCETTHNLTQPEWVTTIWPPGNGTSTVYETLLDLAAWEFSLKFGEPGKKARLRGGPILKQMLANIKNHIDKKSPVKFYMYSAHDNTVMALLHALKASNHQQPPYAATIILELYSVNGTDYAVNVTYKNESGSEPYQIRIPDCDYNAEKLCPLKQFETLTKPMIPEDWDSECQVEKPATYNPRYIIGIGVGLGVVLIMIIIGVVFILKKKKKRDPDYDYHGINDDE